MYVSIRRPGGGAIEMELSKILRAHSRTIAGKQQLVINAFAKALEVSVHYKWYLHVNFLLVDKRFLKCSVM